MYQLGKLSFASYAEELLHLRIPPGSLFMLNGAICSYQNYPEESTFFLFKYVHSPSSMVEDVKYQGRTSTIDGVELLKQAILLDKRVYYTFNSKKEFKMLQPNIMDRTYRWSISSDDFMMFRWNPKISKLVTQGFCSQTLLAKALHEYYIGYKEDGIKPNSYYNNGKYFISDKFIFYNNIIIGELHKGTPIIYDEFSKVFKGDFV